jgi:small GTP-binding protein
VGKSNIISRYVENKFSVGSNTTIGLEFSEKHVNINGKHMILQIWDTAGQERFRALNRTFYNNSLGALVIFDLSDRNSFDQLGRWIAELKENLS